MASCGCQSQQCSCLVVAGNGITVLGNGSVEAPYEISANAGHLEVEDTDTVDLTLTGEGTSGDPYKVTADVIVSPAAVNLMSTGPNGIAVTCEAVQDCVGEAITAGEGLVYDDDAGAVSTRISDDADNAVVIGSDGGLYAAGVSAPTVTGCGLTGDGTSASPITANVGTWGFDCPADAGETLGCGADGVLRGAPVQQVWTPTFTGGDLDFTPPPDSLIDGFDRGFLVNLTNPDPCRSMRGVVHIEATPRLNMDPGTEVVVRIDGDIHHRYRNDGPKLAQLYHRMHTMRPLNIPPGGTQTIRWDVETGLVEGGGRVVTVRCIVRVMGVSQ